MYFDNTRYPSTHALTDKWNLIVKYLMNCGWEIKVVNATHATKSFENSWSLRYRCTALPNKLTWQLGAGHFVDRYWIHRWIVKYIMLNIWKSCNFNYEWNKQLDFPQVSSICLLFTFFLVLRQRIHPVGPVWSERFEWSWRRDDFAEPFRLL